MASRGYCMIVAVTFLSRATTAHSSTCDDDATCETDHSVSLLQRSLEIQGRAHATSQNEYGNIMAHEQDIASCTPLENHETYFSINVTVGVPNDDEPEQTFAVVADTGSNALLVPDCSCKTKGCDADLACFEENQSSTFKLETHETKEGKVLPMEGVLSYGSGDIKVAVSSDFAKVDSVVAKMTKGVFLMLDRRKLLVEGDFEGILGLGLPSPLDPTPMFTVVSGISTYTLCFNDGTKPGALYMKVGPLVNPMTNIGEVHWGLDLQGMSVGDDESAPALFCTPDSKKANMKTACGAIPDSGTTLMVGQKGQVHKLQETICDQWPRCMAASLASPHKKKENVLSDMLLNCSAWLSEDNHELNEAPPLHITLAGAEAIPQKITIPGSAYILETVEELALKVHHKVFGIPLNIDYHSGIFEKVCIPAFDVQDYATTLNGPVWILGTPLFYTYTMGYDIGSHPPKISVEKKPCVECGGSQMEMVSRIEDGAKISLRKVKGPLKQKKWDSLKLL